MGAWYHWFSQFLTTHGFKMCLTDNSLFIHYASQFIMILLVYIDDIRLTGNDLKFI